MTGIRIAIDGSSFSLFAGGPPDYVELLEVENHLGIPRTDWDLSSYRVALFTHRGWPEAQVLTLKEQGRRVGVLFSLQALASENSVLDETEALRSFGFIALQKLCLGELISPDLEATPHRAQSLPITDIFPTDSIVVVLDASEIGRLTGASVDTEFINERLASFGKHGFFMQMGAEYLSEVGAFKANGIALASDRKNLEMRPFSPALPEGTREFLITTFLTSAPYEREPGFRFFLSYQVFESIIQDLYSKLVSRFISKAAGLNSTDLKDCIDELNKSLQEKARLNEILQACPAIHDAAHELALACNSLLQISGSQPQDSPPKALYQVRNLLFHRYAHTSAQRDDLNRVAESLFALVCELATKYEEPNASL